MDTTGTGRRRNRSWPEALKREIVAASFAPGCVGFGGCPALRCEREPGIQLAQASIATARVPRPIRRGSAADPGDGYGRNMVLSPRSRRPSTETIEIESGRQVPRSRRQRRRRQGAAARARRAGAAMIPVPSGVRVWLAVGHTDMRRGMNGLALQVQEALQRDPHAGDLYVFRGSQRRPDQDPLA